MELLSYQEMIDNLQEDNNHLLLGNGFNLSLQVNTSYKEIFERMKKEFPIYKKLETELNILGYDIELIIGRINDSISPDNNFKDFFQHFMQNKIKADFMKSAISIVNDNIKKIYQEKNNDIYLLFKKFNNYFSLNYDPLLYLLLMKYKKKENKIIAFQNKAKFIEDNKIIKNEDLYNIIKMAHSEGLITISYQDNQINRNLKDTTHDDFSNQIKVIIKTINKNITKKEIDKALKQFYEILQLKENELNANDGFQGELFPEYIGGINQNIFFIHGAFHIYQKGKKYYKFKKTSEKSLHKNIEDIIEDENQDIVCIFDSDNKEDKINENEYLTNALDKLTKIVGDLVIFGSALSENDNHIFKRINNNEMISKVYISTCDKILNDTVKRAEIIFPSKEIHYFDFTKVPY